MIKKILPIFAVLIPVCILSFVAGGVLDMFIGGKQPSYGENSIGGIQPSYVYSSIDGVDERRYTITDTTKTYNFDLEALDSISLYLAGVEAEVIASNDDKIHVMVHNTNVNRDAAVVLSAKNHMSTVEVHPTNITFSAAGSGLTGWFEDLFTDQPKCKVWIMLPQKLYGDLNVQQGSGIVSINAINANHNNLEIGSGNLTFTNNPLHRMLELNLKLGSGKVKINNSNTVEYDFDIGSGEFDINGLTGTGKVAMGSGSGTFSYADYCGMVLEKGSGTLEMLLPHGTPIRIVPELGSGKIKVDLDGVSQTISKNGEYNFGGESVKNFLRVENGSGDIYIKNNSDTAPQNPENSGQDSSDSSSAANSNSLDIENSSDPEIANSSSSESTETSLPNAA